MCAALQGLETAESKLRMTSERQQPAQQNAISVTLVSNGEFRVLKVPLGFIKVLQWVFSIFAFATCGSYSGEFRLSVDCKNKTESDLNIKDFVVTVVFAFLWLVSLYVWAKGLTDVKDATDPEHVMTLINSLFTRQDSFRATAPPIRGCHVVSLPGRFRKHGPVMSGLNTSVDFVVTVVFVFLWLVSLYVWAKGLTDVKDATDPEHVMTLIKACKIEGNKCSEEHGPVMSGLNTSVVFGFLNFVLWVGNLWFVFKETGWIAPFMRHPPPSQEKQLAPESFGAPGYVQEPQGYGQPDPYSQGGYQPDYGQQEGYNQGGEYNQQGAPTSFANQM
ncbi:UNVERIFIED_CONTAM: hypothetical protein FKN15_011399 [Acipenser sinensis]